MESFIIVRRSDNSPSGEHYSYAYTKNGSIIAAIGDDLNLIELPDYKGTFRIDHNDELVPILPDQPYRYQSKM